MADTGSTQIVATVIAAIFTSLATVGAAFFGARYAAKLTVEETKRQYEDKLSLTRRQDGTAINARLNIILAALETALASVNGLKKLPNDKSGIVISTNTVEAELSAKIAALDDDSARALDTYQLNLASATRFENTHIHGNWDKTRDIQSSWIAALWLQAWEIKKAVARSVNLPTPKRPLGWRLRLMWLRWRLPSKWKQDGGL